MILFLKLADKFLEGQVSDESVPSPPFLLFFSSALISIHQESGFQQKLIGLFCKLIGALQVLAGPQVGLDLALSHPSLVPVASSVPFSDAPQVNPYSSA